MIKLIGRYKNRGKYIYLCILCGAMGLISSGYVPRVIAESVINKSDTNKYSTSFEFSIKGGNQRFISRPGLVIPIYQSADSILNLNLINLFDSKGAIEGNIGIGFRKMLLDKIYGFYGFYDIRRTQNQNIFHQLTIGAEYFTQNTEFRANIYLPNVTSLVRRFFQ